MDALNMLKLFWPLLLVLGILAILSVYYGCSKGRLLAAGVLFLGSMAANFVFIFAAYYPTRAAFYTVLLLVLAIGVLLPELMDSASALPLACAVWALLLITSYQALLGSTTSMRSTAPSGATKHHRRGKGGGAAGCGRRLPQA